MAEFDDNNVYAKNIEGGTIHISEAASGRKGYFCLGCDREMQAVISRIQYRASYFRHDPKAVLGQPKCTYRDETYRHRLAKIILARLKSLHVPALYKYPPKGENGLAVLIEEAKTIEAFSVGLEKEFYEDENGKIHCVPNKESDDKFLVIRPDVTFFDKDNKPILLVELVATHKLSDDKKIKLKRLGIDVIQIKIPKDSPESIEKCLLTGEKTKWIYSHVEENTEYVPVSSGNTTGISPIDEEQRKLFEETFVCRRAQINNLVRTIKRCLESKPYRDIEQSLRGELSRVEGNTEEHRERLNKLRKDFGERVDRKFESESRKIENEEGGFEIEETDFSQHFKDLERRYNSKRSDLERQEKLIVSGDSDEIIAVERIRKDIDGRGERNRDTQHRIRREIKAADAGSRGCRKELGA
ncbi:MAG: hypothetical protein NT084_14485, partial [Bacteroidetes bacterium]|nr:hypothetical protein [Bacteroidota bacterium]